MGAIPDLEASFGANVPRLLEIIAVEAYRQPDVFLRELICNSYDAALRRGALEPPAERWKKVSVRRQADDVLEISDEGIGMTGDELVHLLSQIGRSSSQLGSLGGESSIGHFGVGFLSVLAVADSVEVDTLSASSPESGALTWRWRKGIYYSIRQSLRRESGTTVRVTLKQQFKKYTGQRVLASLIAHHLPFLDVSIDLNHQGDPRHGFDLERQVLSIDARPRGTTLSNQVPFLREDVLHYVMTGIGRNNTALLAFPAHPTRGEACMAVYQRGVLVHERSANLLPAGWQWICGLVEINDGNLTLGRSEVIEDEKLEALQVDLQRLLEQEVVWLAERFPKRFRRIFRKHHRAFWLLLRHSTRLLEKLGPHVLFQTTLGELPFQDLVQRAESTEGIRSIPFLLGSPHSEPRWATARSEGKLVVWCQDPSETWILRTLANLNPEVEILELFWGNKVKLEPGVPVLPPRVNILIDQLRGYFEDHKILVEPAVLDSTAILSVTELSGPKNSGVEEGLTDPSSRLLDAISKTFRGLNESASPLEHSRLLINLASSQLPAVAEVARSKCPLELVAALLFTAGVVKTGVAIPADWQPTLDHFIDLGVSSLLDLPADPTEHVVCFFAHDFSEHKPLLSALRATLEHDPFYWEVRSGEEEVQESELFDNVYRQINESHVVLAEITRGNPNVILEAGIALGLSQKPPLGLLAIEGSNLKISDLQGHLLFYYDEREIKNPKKRFALRLRDWVTHHESFASLRKTRPFLGYRLLEEARLLSAKECHELQALIPEPRTLLGEDAARVTGVTGISIRRISAVQSFFKRRVERFSGLPCREKAPNVIDALWRRLPRRT